MIDEEVLSVVRNRVALDMEDRRSTLGREIGSVKERASMHGALMSSGTQRLIMEAIGNELRVRASMIWHVFARALEAKGVALSTEIGGDIKTTLASMLAEHSEDLSQQREDAQNLMRGSRTLTSIEDLTRAAKDRVNSEIDFAVLKQSSRTDEGAAKVNVYQGYGIVQTGAGSTASMTVSIGTEERREIELALTAVEESLQRLGGEGESERAQAVELISDVRGELERDEPNGLRIRGALQGLATTVQSIAAAPEAYQLLKGAAALIGLQLP